MTTNARRASGVATTIMVEALMTAAVYGWRATAETQWHPAMTGAVLLTPFAFSLGVCARLLWPSGSGASVVKGVLVRGLVPLVSSTVGLYLGLLLASTKWGT